MTSRYKKKKVQCRIVRSRTKNRVKGCRGFFYLRNQQSKKTPREDIIILTTQLGRNDTHPISKYSTVHPLIVLWSRATGRYTRCYLFTQPCRERVSVPWAPGAENIVSTLWTSTSSQTLSFTECRAVNRSTALTIWRTQLSNVLWGTQDQFMFVDNKMLSKRWRSPLQPTVMTKTYKLSEAKFGIILLNIYIYK